MTVIMKIRFMFILCKIYLNLEKTNKMQNFVQKTYERKNMHLKILLSKNSATCGIKTQLTNIFPATCKIA